MPHFDDDETEELVRYIGSDLAYGVADFEELDDGTVIVATYDDAAEVDWVDPDLQPEMADAIEDGDAWGIIHFDRRGEQLDSVWGYIGWGGPLNAIDAYVDEAGLDRTRQGERWAKKRAKQRERDQVSEGIIFE